MPFSAFRANYSSNDQIRGKAERKAKKALYEYITGSDFGDGDETSTQVVDAVAVEIKQEANTGATIGIDPNAAAIVQPQPASPQPQPIPTQQTAAQPQQPTPTYNANKPAF